MAFIRLKKGRYPEEGGVWDYVCSEKADIDKLPKFGIPGTQDGDPYHNVPCGFGSSAMIKGEGVVFLWPDNTWASL